METKKEVGYIVSLYPLGQGMAISHMAEKNGQK